MVDNPPINDGKPDNDDGARETERATYARALDDILAAPASHTDPYTGVAAYFGQLSRRVRLLLQSLSDRDVDTLIKVIRLHQGSERTGRFLRRLVVWGAGAVAGTLAFGDNITKGIDKIRDWLW